MSGGLEDLCRRATYPLIVPFVLGCLWVYARVAQGDWWLERPPRGTDAAAAVDFGAAAGGPAPEAVAPPAPGNQANASCHPGGERSRGAPAPQVASR